MCNASKNPNLSVAWALAHRNVCEKNFDGNGGAVEAEAAKRIWQRSINKYKLRYTTLLSDGDAKTYSDLQKLGDALYDKDHPIGKEECINHVAKRMKTGLIKLKNDHKGTANRISGQGRVTEKIMTKVQSYYGRAIRLEAQEVKIYRCRDGFA